MTDNNIDNSIKKLDEILNALGNNGNWVFVARISNIAKNLVNGNFEVRFSLKNTTAKEPIIKANTPVQLPIDIDKEIDKRVNAALERKSLEDTIQDLKSQLKEKNVNPVIDNLIATLKPHLSEIITAITGRKVNVPAIGTTEIHTEEPPIQTEDSNQQQVLSDSIQYILHVATAQKIDGVNMFKRIATKLKTTPELLEDLQDFLN